MTAAWISSVVAFSLAVAQPSPPTEAPAPAPTSEPAPAPTSEPPATAPESNAAKWEQVERVSTPAPVPPPQVVVVQQPVQPQPLPPPPPPRRVGNGALGAGIALVSAGFASIVLVGGIAGLVKIVALDNARNPNTAISSREERYNRARRADNAMEAGFWIGVTGIGIGIALIAVGATMKSRARREAMARRVSPAGGGIAIHF